MINWLILYGQLILLPYFTIEKESYIIDSVKERDRNDEKRKKKENRIHTKQVNPKMMQKHKIYLQIKYINLFTNYSPSICCRNNNNNAINIINLIYVWLFGFGMLL